MIRGSTNRAEHGASGSEERKPRRGVDFITIGEGADKEDISVGDCVLVQGEDKDPYVRCHQIIRSLCGLRFHPPKRDILVAEQIEACYLLLKYLSSFTADPSSSPPDKRNVTDTGSCADWEDLELLQRQPQRGQHNGGSRMVLSARGVQSRQEGTPPLIHTIEIDQQDKSGKARSWRHVSASLPPWLVKTETMMARYSCVV